MRFSIIVQIHNGAPALPETVSSLLEQDCRDLEVILLDDGSTDGSSMLCDGYLAAFPQIIRVIHRETANRSGAKNAALEAALGEYLLFMDCGDQLDRSALACLNRFVDETEADVCLFRCREPGKNRNLPGRGRGAPMVVTLSDCPQAIPVDPGMRLGLWRRRLFLDSGLRFGKSVWHGDLILAAKLLPLCRKIAVVTEELYIRGRSRQDTLQSRQRSGELMDVLDELRRYYAGLGRDGDCRGWLTALAAEQVLEAANRMLHSGREQEMLHVLTGYLNTHFPGYETQPLLGRRCSAARYLRNGQYLRLRAALFRSKV